VQPFGSIYIQSEAGICNGTGLSMDKGSREVILDALATCLY
jgi:hypothetical protein